jgi:hypothetical protein
MPNFITDLTSLPYPKTQLNPLPGGADPDNYLLTTDWTDVCQALIDIRGYLVAGTALGMFGDGSDGDVVISADTNLARDMYYNNLTINSGKVLSTKNFRVHVKGTLTLTGDISNSGAVGATGLAFGAGGIAVTTGSLPRNESGGSGTQNGNGNDGGLGTATIRGMGASGAGGAGNANTGGAAQSATIGAASLGDFRSIPHAVTALWPAAPGNTITTGPGGGGGGGDTGGTWGGGGGASGGWLIVCARLWTGAGNLFAKGGDGGSAAGQAGNQGGGGGGAGGIISFLTSKATSPTMSVAGGIGGLGNGSSGHPGTDGGVGVSIALTGI